VTASSRTGRFGRDAHGAPLARGRDVARPGPPAGAPVTAPTAWSARTPRPGVVSALLGGIGRLRREPPAEWASLAACAVLSVAIAGGAVAIDPMWVPPAGQTLPVLFGGLLLSRRSLGRLLLVVTAGLLYDGLVLGFEDVRPGAFVLVGVTALVAAEFARSREETGLGGLRGDSVLVELRGRLEHQGRLPVVPAPWRAEAVVRPAGGGPFAGDFVVSSLTDDGRRLEVALVDVSGKGVEAGTRALLLSGALGGLLGSVPSEDFLACANDYLCRQQWDEGFATAVHLVVDLRSGAATVVSAGHPPVAFLDAGTGRWGLVEEGGPALGLIPGASFEPSRLVLDPGDAVLLYTDGLVEVPGRDLSVGVDKLLGEAERLIPRGFAGGGEVLVNRVAAGSSDDRGLVLLWRTR
jgi:hypothetical protein